MQMTLVGGVAGWRSRQIVSPGRQWAARSCRCRAGHCRPDVKRRVRCMPCAIRQGGCI